MKLRTTREIGSYGEQKAVNYLRLHGYTVKERNWVSGKAEIDIIAETFRDLVFVEVKARTYTAEEMQYAPPPGVAVNAKKQQLTRRAAEWYMVKHPTRKQPRMDVIEIWLLRSASDQKPKVARIHHIKAAY